MSVGRKLSSRKLIKTTNMMITKTNFIQNRLTKPIAYQAVPKIQNKKISIKNPWTDQPPLQFYLTTSFWKVSTTIKDQSIYLERPGKVGIEIWTYKTHLIPRLTKKKHWTKFRACRVWRLNRLRPNTRTKKIRIILGSSGVLSEWQPT